MRDSYSDYSSVHSLSIEAQSTAPSEGFIIDATCGIGTRISGLLIPIQSSGNSTERNISSSKSDDDCECENFVLFGMYTTTIDMKRWAHIEAHVSIPHLTASPTSKPRFPPPIRIAGVFHDTLEYGSTISMSSQFDAEFIEESFSPDLEIIGAPIVDMCLVRSRDPHPPLGFVKVMDTRRKQFIKPPPPNTDGKGANFMRVVANQTVIPPTSMNASLRPGPTRLFQPASTPLAQHEDVHLYIKRSWGELSSKSGGRFDSDLPLPIVDVCVLSVSLDPDSQIGALGDLRDLSPALTGYSLIHGEPLLLEPALASSSSSSASTSPRIGMFIAIKRATRVLRPSTQPTAPTSRSGESSATASLKPMWPYNERNLLLDVEVLFSDPVEFEILPGGFKKINKTVPPPTSSTPRSLDSSSSSTPILVSQDANLNTLGASSVKSHLAIRLGVPLRPAGEQCPVSGCYTIRTPKESAFVQELIGPLLNLSVRGPVPVTALKGSIAEYTFNIEPTTSASSGGSANLLTLSNAAMRRFDSSASSSPLTTTADVFQTSKGGSPRGIPLGPREVAAVALPVSSAVHLQHAIETGVLALPGIFSTTSSTSSSSYSATTDDLNNEAWYTLGTWKPDTDNNMLNRRESTSSTRFYGESSRQYVSNSSSMFELAFMRSASTLGSGASLSRANSSMMTNKVQQPMVEAVGIISNPKNPSSLSFWKLHAQHVLRIVWRRDLSSLYRNGKLVESSRLPKLELNLMVSKNKSIVGSAQCEGCGNRVPLSSTTFVASPPRHLLVNLLRMRFNKKIGNASKVHAFVDIPLELQLPAPSAHNLDVIQRKIEASNCASASEGQSSEPPSSALSLPLADGETLYGLYSIIVHKGESANSGHYFCFARRSGANLRKPDDLPDAPWMLFDDDRVSATSWNEIKSHLSSSVSESAYAVLYKRIDGVEGEKEGQTNLELASWVKALAADNYNVIRKLATSTSPAFLDAYHGSS